MFPMDKHKNIPNDINNTEENEQISGQTDKISGDSANPQMDTVDEQNLDSKKPKVPKGELEKKPAQKRASIGKGSILVEPIKRRSFFPWLGWHSLLLPELFLESCSDLCFPMFFLNLNRPSKLDILMTIVLVMLPQV